ncbi:nucleotide pyrophosphohydrolase [Methanocella arvoryzae]|uniref:Nucleotide pyrophosphohydrolase (MazG family) n=1 Tax=Methanocella arvoryzae (strain DSM 22066 / NBRC 105507 / MRE50) TaxID=351160 RepID=Q0W0W1_METAR|nr:nucleotide pyrophosphohydrolase [Methanocella arvoryzae]CAJ37982.1 putative nucleotide pyrophosphohydrolase (MazG family) [Methanocella arvoryzae MRE50]
MADDRDTTIDVLKERTKSFCEARDWDQYHDAKELAISITVEAAELLELFRFKSREEMERLFSARETREEICDEVADVLFALLRFSQLYDIDVVTEFNRKMAKNEVKYPVELARGSNKKYDEF